MAGIQSAGLPPHRPKFNSRVPLGKEKTLVGVRERQD